MNQMFVSQIISISRAAMISQNNGCRDHRPKRQMAQLSLHAIRSVRAEQHLSEEIVTMTIEIIELQLNNNLIKVQKKVQCLAGTASRARPAHPADPQ